MPSQGHAPPDQPDEDVEVYANGVAFEKVKGWLGSAGDDLQFDQWFGVEDVDADRPSRQERLGLGAKFLSHDKAQRLTGGVHTKLDKALQRSQRRREEEEEEEEERGRGTSKQKSAASGKNEKDDDSSDSDAGGRAGVTFSNKRKAKVYNPLNDPSLTGSIRKKKKK